MFNIGDTVLYGSDGVCKITDITEKVFSTFKAKYYILTPVFDKRSTFFVPLDNKKLTDKMHKILSVSEIRDIIENIDEGYPWIADDSKRGEEFKEILSSGNIAQIANMAACLEKHRLYLSENGKHLHKSDEHIYKSAISVIYEELAMVTKVNKEDIPDILCKKISIS